MVSRSGVNREASPQPNNASRSGLNREAGSSPLPNNASRSGLNREAGSSPLPNNASRSGLNREAGSSPLPNNASRSGLNREAGSSPLPNNASRSGLNREVESSPLPNNAIEDYQRSGPDSDEAPGQMLKEELPRPVNDLAGTDKTGDAEAEGTQSVEKESAPAKASETMKVEESEQIVQEQETKRDGAEEMKKEAAKAPKMKDKRKKSRGAALESTFVSPNDQSDKTGAEKNDLEIMEPPFLKSKEMVSCPEEEWDPNFDLTIQVRKLKRRPLETVSPEKMCIERKPEVSEDKPGECDRTEEFKDLVEELLEIESKKTPPVTAASDQQVPANEELETPLGEMDSSAYTRPEEEDDDAILQIGPETLVCHEVDLDDFHQKYKSCDAPVAEKSESNTPTSDTPALLPSIEANLSEALLSLGQDESRSTKSESDITIEVDSVAEESQEGLCESESANGFEASTASSSCIIQEQDLEEKAQSIDSEDLPNLDNKSIPMKQSNASKSRKRTRSSARVTSRPMKDMEKDKYKEKPQDVPAKTYKWSFPIEILATMTSDERIVFIQDKLQEMRQQYHSLRAEVAAIDERRKRFKKKRRQVSRPVASTSSVSSETGVSPSPSPPQNAASVQCR